MSSRTLTALVGASALCVAAGSAQAAVTFIGYQSELNTDETLVTEFEGGPTLADVLVQAGFALTGDAGLFSGSTAGVAAAPAVAVGDWDDSQYLGIRQNQTAVLDTPLLSQISFYVGSLDSFNRFTFHLADGTTQVFTGATLAALPSIAVNGDWNTFSANGRLTFSFDSAIDSVELASGGNSFEISDIGAIAFAAVPEPATWAMMIMGFGGVGALLRRRQAMVAA